MEKVKIFNGSTDCIFNMGNGLFFNDLEYVNESFRNNLVKNYDSEVGPLDKNFINQWSAKKTKNNITEPVSTISNNVFMILLNVVYFKAQWKNQFSKHNYKGDFYLDNFDQKQEVT